MRDDRGVVARSRGAALRWVLAAVALVVVVASAWLVWQAASDDDGEPSDGTATAPTATAPATAPAPAPAAGATSFLITPTDPGTATPELVEGTAGLLTQRLTGTGGLVTVEKGWVRVDFPDPPDPALVEHLLDPTVVAFRPVLVVTAPDPTEAPGGATGPAAGTPTSPSDVEFYATGPVLSALAELDCTDPTAAPYASTEGALVTCDAAGSSKYLLGPVEISGEALAAVEVGEVPTGLGYGEVPGSRLVTIRFDGAGTDAFRDLTTRLTDLAPPLNQLAIVVDDRVVSAPSVQETITAGEVVISGEGDETFPTVAAALMFGREGFVWQVADAA